MDCGKRSMPPDSSTCEPKLKHPKIDPGLRSIQVTGDHAETMPCPLGQVRTEISPDNPTKSFTPGVGNISQIKYNQALFGHAWQIISTKLGPERACTFFNGMMNGSIRLSSGPSFSHNYYQGSFDNWDHEETSLDHRRTFDVMGGIVSTQAYSELPDSLD
ncbi:hypothetical protein QAD02_021388 [Eretmocerus hayati]|uniref:Uncharacterized protein n=1 Tax=Eretmocerus hayati TaxID=131215 RepID=A0ACC2PQA7_9HYME|nr:hypothetical protein QAD02_021388 [Eretmocerus hayati]